MVGKVRVASQMMKLLKKARKVKDVVADTNVKKVSTWFVVVLYSSLKENSYNF